MSLYATLNVSPLKKRYPDSDNDEEILSPKKVRISHATKATLPLHLTKLSILHNSILHALSHALATCPVAPSVVDGVVTVKGILNHFTLEQYGAVSTGSAMEDFKRVIWLWEWDKAAQDKASASQPDDDDDNPFLLTPAKEIPKDWLRGGMGLTISPTTHFHKLQSKRVPAYGVGIQVIIPDSSLSTDVRDETALKMNAVARWTANSESSRQEMRTKLNLWAATHDENERVPIADLPQLVPANSARTSALTRKLEAISPRSSATTRSLGPPSSSSPSSPTRLSKSPIKSSLAFPPMTPQSNRTHQDSFIALLTPQKTPSRMEEPITPSSSSIPVTPSTSRRQALYDRVRARSLSQSPKKTSSHGSPNTPSQIGTDELRRRCLLGRLGGVAESVWMLFTAPTTNGNSLSPRKRRALPTESIVAAIIKSSPVPISGAEARESLKMLSKLAPWFIRDGDDTVEEYMEMPAPEKEEEFVDVVNRSPKRVKNEGGGLRRVRELIRRELEQ